MVQVSINGVPFQEDFNHIGTMADLVEFIKAHIDPDEIITSLLMNDNQLSEVDWRVPLSVHGDAQLEVLTGSQSDYLSDRFSAAVEYLAHIAGEFVQARDFFQDGNHAEGNTALARAVDDFNAFLGWYSTLMSMLPESFTSDASEFHAQVKDISETCESLLKQQMYQSWWAIGETLENDLEPKLTRLNDKCSRLASQWT